MGCYSKYARFSAVFIIMLIVPLLASCGAAGSASSPAPSQESAPSETVQVELTADELAVFDGSDGNPAYIAVDGVIYDVTDVLQWKEGKHNGFTAGKDLTQEIKNISPHGIAKLTGIPVVGKLKP